MDSSTDILLLLILGATLMSGGPSVHEIVKLLKEIKTVLEIIEKRGRNGLPK